MKFKTRMINAAVAAALGTVAGAAQAVNLAADGGGQVVIYPYYTVQSLGGNPYDTYISIVNSDDTNGKAVKVRFLEPKNSKEVLDFNLYMSPNDMWTATITRDSSGNAILRTTDNSCTVPAIPIVSTVGTVVTREVGFVNFAYNNDRIGDNSLARAREGYAEIILMADLQSGLKNGIARDTYADALHNAAQVPANCGAIAASWLSNAYNGGTGPFAIGGSGVALPNGTLSGATTIINVLNGLDISNDGIALAGFSTSTRHYQPGNNLPNLADVNPKFSAVLDGSTLTVTDWSGAGTAFPILPVTAIFDRVSIVNEFAFNTGNVGLGSDWVVTQPTKGIHYSLNANLPTAPYTASLTTTGACEAISLTTYNREEQSSTALAFSPPGQGSNLCWEVGVISWGSSNVLGGLLTRQTISSNFTEGWVRMNFAQTVGAGGPSTTKTTYLGSGGLGAVSTSTTLNSIYTGLPVISFLATTFLNQSSLASYGSAYNARYSRQINP